MRPTSARLAGGLVACALLFSGGCLWCPPTRPAEWLRSLKPTRGPQGEDVVVLEVSVIEQPVGDRGLNRDLWTGIDEGAVAIDRRAVLEDNGFRVAIAGGGTSDTLNALLQSQRTNPRPRQLQTRAGTIKTVQLGDGWHRCAFEVKQDGQPTAVEFEQAQCVMSVTPTLAPNGRVTLAFAPQVEHGTPKLLTQDAHGDFVLHGRRPVEPYPALAFEVTLSSRDYVVVGTWTEKGATLGHRCFVTTDGPRPVQRLLAIRAGRRFAPAAPGGGTEATGPTTAVRPPVAPLAYQAAMTVRGQKD